MKRWMDKIRFMAVIMVSVFIAACFFTGTVMGKGEADTQELEGYYHSKEQSLVEDAREFLKGEGYADSGVMLTRVIESDGSRQYTLTIHHRRIDKLEEAERQLLVEKLEKIAFKDANSTFCCKFFINQ